jgi:signal transduction histidine kinase
MESTVEGGTPGSETRMGKALLLTLLLGLLGYLGNLVRLPLVFDLAFIFGSIATLICTVLLGWRFGLVATLLASAYTYFLWNHPYAMIILGAETLWVGLALRRPQRNLLLVDTMYWGLVGIPLVILFYGGFQHLGLENVAATALKQAINGVINAQVAGAILRYLPLERWLGQTDRPKRFPLSTALFDVTVLLQLIPSVALIVSISRWEVRQEQQQAAARLEMEATYRVGVLRSWIDHQVLAMGRVAALGRSVGRTPLAHLQEDLSQIHALAPNFRNVFFADADGRSLLFDPPVNPAGRTNLGLDFSDHPWFQEVKRGPYPLVSGVFRGSRAAFSPIFTVSVPLFQDGNFKGVGAGAVNLGDLQALLSQNQGENSPFFTLLDSQGRVVASTDLTVSPLESAGIPSGMRTQPVAGGVVLRLPPKQRNISVMDSWKQARYDLQVPVSGTGWTLSASLPAGPLQLRAYDLVTWSLAGLGVVFLLVLIVASLLARALSQASVRLAAFSRDLPPRIERGEELIWPQSHFEEIDQLTTHFRDTSRALGERLHQLEVQTEKRIATERALIHQSRLAAMGEMIGHIAHQWRQPLNALSMLLANLRDAQREGQGHPQDLEPSFAKGNALIQKMSTTIGDFMNFFHPEKEMVGFSALHQVQAGLSLVDASLKFAHIAVQVEAPADLRLFGFPNEYSQVVLNLLSNAKQAIAETQPGSGQIRIGLAVDGEFGRLTVWDSGGGIPPEVLERIFDPYFSTRQAGTGIGLYMSKQIIEESMGGRISARNVEGGAEFTVLVPLAGGRT